MFAWVFVDGSISGHHTPADLMARCQAKGYEWVALELDDPHSHDANMAAWDSCMEQAHIRGMKFGPWFTEGGEIYKTPGGSDFAIAEVEGPGDLQGVTNVINGQGGGPLPSCSLAICTNFSTLNRDNCKPVIDAGFACLTESYINESAGMTPDNMDRVARYLGWPTSQPVFGVYPVGGNPPPSYAQWQDWPGVDYLGEYVV
jgi:hypothetical protein